MEFFSNASQEERQARRQRLDGYIDEALQYYLGPTGLPDKLKAAAQMLNPMVGLEQASVDAQRAADPSLATGERITSGASSLANTLAMGLPALMASKAALSPAAALMNSVGVPDAQVPDGRAIIRRDDVFRGEGPAQVSYAGGRNPDMPYAQRFTDDRQLEDMIASGLVRPKPGGYGKQGKSTIYFGEADSPDLPTTGINRLNDSKNIGLVGGAEDMMGYPGGIPIDRLQRIMALRNGEPTDILQEVLKRNREYVPDALRPPRAD